MVICLFIKYKGAFVASNKKQYHYICTINNVE
jgi:hypothetical protein